MDKQTYLRIRGEIKFPILNHFLLTHALGDCILLTAGVSLNYFLKEPASYFLLSPLIAVFMFRKFGLMHEAVHGSLHERKNVNEILGVLSGALCLLPFEQWKKSHIQHHFWSGNVEKDPVMALVTKLPKFPEPLKNSISFLWKLWFPVLSLLQHLVFWILSLKAYKTSNRSIYETASLLAPVVFWSSLVTFADSNFFFCGVLPGLILYLIGTEVINLPHHLQLPQLRGDERYPLWEQYQSARTCLYPTWVASFCILNFNYHAEHHMFPEAPWYYLRQIQQKITPILEQKYHCDPMLEWIVENRRENVEVMLLKTRETSIQKIRKIA